MADAWTSTTTQTLDQTAYDRMVYWPLRAELYFDAVADVGPTRQSMPGASVVFTLVGDLAAATTALNEIVDVETVTMTTSNITLTLVEYGNAMITTAKLRATSYVEVDPVVANVVGYNAGISQDTLASNALVAGTNVRYGGTATSRVTVAAGHTLTAAHVRRTLADLRTANVGTLNGSYAAFIHPDVSYDLRGETGAAAWRDPHTYSAPSEIWNGEIGKFENFRFVETPRAPVFANAGVGGTVEVYRTIFVGRQALAKAFSTSEGNGSQPRVVISPQTDRLRRWKTVGWYWLGAYGIFRQEALRAYETSSSIATNT